MHCEFGIFILLFFISAVLEKFHHG